MMVQIKICNICKHFFHPLRPSQGVYCDEGQHEVQDQNAKQSDSQELSQEVFEEKLEERNIEPNTCTETCSKLTRRIELLFIAL